ncbi:MAG TPA: phosphoribosylformylglycinamidine synthase subunit PurL [bacterium]|nr:phosphoribosylformylglycinamidine synthase subunit PurL [bacterium]
MSPTVEITPEIVKEHGLKPDEYERILKILGRQPNLTELGVYSVMWSEHCGYKHSKEVLRKFTTQGDKVLQGPGENAGIMDIGEGWAVAFKVESHNHPSAVEPYQGAATGVGGILRDIFTMGARPIANLNSLRFGPLALPKVKHLFTGVVKGIADYGNCMGIPTVAGEVVFDETYTDNCLVNAMSVGLVRHEHIIRGKASGVGNAVIYIGATTGRDGIHGATFASTEISDESQEKRSAVQVADPFMEKLLMEATLELIQGDLLVGIQDMGAAGLTCSTCEMASRGGAGIEIDVAKVPQREGGMTPYEILLSESQERMLLVAKPGCEQKVHDVLAKWDLHAATIGKVTDTGLMVVKEKGKTVVEVPAQSLTEPPIYHPAKSEPAILKKHREFDEASIAVPKDLTAVLLRLLADPTIASKRWVYRQYDHMVRTNTYVRPGSDAAVVRVKGTALGLAMTIDGNGAYCALDPYEGGKIAVAEAARNIACSGAEPLGMTDCLNYGSPEKPEVFYMFERSVSGVADASAFLKIPVTGGNVSLYNESPQGAIDPTPIVGMIGLFKDVQKRVTQWFKKDGDVIYLLGAVGDSIGASRYLHLVHGQKTGLCPRLVLDTERKLHRLLIESAQAGLLQSAHDCSEGGLAVALAESCFSGLSHEEGMKGAKVSLPGLGRLDGRLFGEAQSRAVVSCDPGKAAQFEAAAAKLGVPLEKLGSVGGDELQIGDAVKLSVREAADLFNNAIEKIMA